MELKNRFMIYIGMVVLILLFLSLFIKFSRKGKYKGGKKVSNTLYMKDEPYFKKKVLQYKILSYVLTGSFILGIAVSFFMLSRPYKNRVVDKEKYSRDIMLCLDISASVDYLNTNLIEELKDTVSNLQGERFGILIFNCNPVLFVPLTDDYEYVLEQLDLIERVLKINMGFATSLDDYYLFDYIVSGTQIGPEERGSSLIGDGLAACAYDFPDLDKERTRVIIFATDNDIQGTPVFTLDEAADVCKENKITVFGVGTKEMSNANIQSMEDAVVKTGGKFFLENKSGTFEEIVDEIEKTSKSLVKGGTQVQQTDIVGVPFIILLFSVLLMMIVTKQLKR